MQLPVVTGGRASCGDTVVGNPTVLVENAPIGVVGESFVGTGLIGGPGATRVFVANMPVSVIGDSVSPHGDPKSPHIGAVIVDPGSRGRVFVT